MKIPTHRSSPAQAAFTLIELLVVITIIAILAGIALPVFQSAMEKSTSVKDAANLRNLGVGFRAYLNDNDESFPGQPGANGVTDAWPKTLETRYVTDWKVFQSPFDKRSVATADPQNVSYGLNDKVYAAATSSLSQWTAPSLTVLAAPSNTGDANIAGSWTGNSNAPKDITAGSLTAGTPLGTHAKGKRINALFGDMHVESNMNWVTYATTNGTSDADKLRWQAK